MATSISLVFSALFFCSFPTYESVATLSASGVACITVFTCVFLLVNFFPKSSSPWPRCLDYLSFTTVFFCALFLVTFFPKSSSIFYTRCIAKVTWHINCSGYIAFGIMILFLPGFARVLCPFNTSGSPSASAPLVALSFYCLCSPYQQCYSTSL
jgi:hypothetical protein